MAKETRPDPDYASRMPPKPTEKPVELFELIASAAMRDSAHAIALLEWAGQGLDEPALTKLLIDGAKWVSSSNDEDVPKRLAWCEALVARGADPFAGQGEDPGSFRYEGSLVERLARAGRWEYLSSIVDRAGSGGLARAKEALERLGSRGYAAGDPYLMALSGGPRAVAFLAKAGFDPNALVKGDPWVFHCDDGPTLQALADAGADLSVKGKIGLSLEEFVAQRPSGRARQGMLDVIHAHRASAPAKPGQSEQAIKSLASLAQDGNYRELAKAAAAAGVDLAKVKDASGASMLAIALSRANWPLAADLMSLAKADPAEPSLLSGAPTGALALWGSSSSLRKTPKSFLNRQDECLALAFSEAVMSWKSAEGAPLLEACSKLMPADRKGFERPGSWLLASAKAAVKAEPPSAPEPLWFRLSEMGQSIELVAFAALSRPEPWIFGGKGLMATLLMGRGRYLSGSPLSEMESDLARHSRREQRLADFYSLPQWALAFEALWGQASKEVADLPADGAPCSWGPAMNAARELERSIRSCARWGKSGVGPGLDAGVLSGLIQEGFEPSRGLGDHVLLWARGLALAACSEQPEAAGSMALDFFARDEPRALAIAEAIVEASKSRFSSFALPEGHPALNAPLSEAQAGSALWRHVEQTREAKASEPVGRAARRL